jgi:hypothetical protein
MMCRSSVTARISRSKGGTIAATKAGHCATGDMAMTVRDKLATVGVNASLKATWSRPWLVMWAVVSVGLLTAAFLLPFRTWFVLAVVFFGIPESYGILAGKYDAYPPLTHVIRHFLKNYLAFPLIYFFFGRRISLGSPNRGLDHPGTLGDEHLIEGLRVLGVSIPVRNVTSSSSPSIDRFLACCATNSPEGLRVDDVMCNLRDPTSMKKSTESVRKNTVSTVKKSHAKIPSA